MKHPEKDGQFGVYQERVGFAIIALIGGGIAAVSGPFVGAQLNDTTWMYAGIALGVAGVLYFSICVLTTIAAGVDYVKLIADQQAVAISKKTTQGPTPHQAPTPQGGRKLGKPMFDE